MNLLSGTAQGGFYSGNILIDGRDVESNLRTIVAHVECFDFHISEFTVLQNLYYSAFLRVGRLMQRQECVNHCKQIANMLKLTTILDVVVGSDLRKGISGGQKKLLSIAIELLSLPRVICLDEPTSGKDLTRFLLTNTLSRSVYRHICCQVSWIMSVSLCCFCLSLSLE
jgi:ABC-type multidrug transport system ATPase subunit